jgi:hypothetical protein
VYLRMVPVAPRMLNVLEAVVSERAVVTAHAHVDNEMSRRRGVPSS